MELKVFTNNKGNALYYMRSVRKKGKKNPTKEKVKFLGYEEDLKKLYDDPIAHFREEAKKLTSKEREEKRVNLSINLDEHFPLEEQDSSLTVIDDLASIGHLPLSVIYHELEIDQFVKNRRKHWPVKANVESIFRLLVFGRILFPASKFSTWKKRAKLLLGNSEFSDDDVYRSLEFFATYSDDLLVHLHQKVKKLYKRDTSLMFYDVTNYFWEIDSCDADTVDGEGSVVFEGLRKYGPSKEHRPEPIVQLGLFMDTEGLPVDFGLFAGNNNDVTTFLPMIKHTKERMGFNKMIYIGDKGIMSGTNVANILAQKQGYIISDSVRKQDKETERFILDDEGYRTTTAVMKCHTLHEEERLMDYTNSIGPYQGSEDAVQEVVVFKMKSRLVPAEESSWVEDGSKKVKVTINKRQIVFFSRKYQVRSRIDRCNSIKKAQQTGTIYNGHGANKYFTKQAYDPQTGKLLQKAKHIRYLDEKKIAKDELFDGYYLIETNVIGTNEDEKPWDGHARFRTYDCLFELNRPVTDQDIVEMYRGLWKIEESFKITKTHLRARPVFVRKPQSIQAHFLSCFVALLLIRILEIKKLHNKMPYSKIIETLQAAKVGEVQGNIYKNYCSSPHLREIGLATTLDLWKVFYTKQELRSMNNKTKDIY
ncbi:MAG: IS1634 family transposase [Sphaerochaetaceae bacterium]